MNVKLLLSAQVYEVRTCADKSDHFWVIRNPLDFSFLQEDLLNVDITNRIKVLLLVPFFIIMSCAYYDEKTPPDPSTITSGTISWRQVQSEFFQPRCAICHSNGGAGINVSHYSDVLTHLSRIRQVTLVRKSMPPDSPLTDYEYKLFETWMNDGTPYSIPETTQ